MKTLSVAVALGVLVSAAAGCSHSDIDVPNAGPALSADTQRVFESPNFTAFANQAHLSTTQAILVARTLALYADNDAALRTTANGADNLANMHRQLRGDTLAQLQLQIPAPGWDAFKQSGLLDQVTEAP
jgi:hypothetical protein